MSISHLAGAEVTARNLVRQRCQWCDFILVDVDLNLTSWTGDGPPVFSWAVGAWVEVGDGNPVVSSVLVPEPGKFPKNSCMARELGPKLFGDLEYGDFFKLVRWHGFGESNADQLYCRASRPDEAIRVANLRSKMGRLVSLDAQAPIELIQRGEADDD